jgi:crotonobetainyl-CoA:carnitine CoA-transferase CaiB-like acyl-CoA transferase
MAILTQEISAMDNLGVDFARSETGVSQPWLNAPFGFYRTSDGWLALSMGDLAVVATVFDEVGLDDLDPWLDRDEVKRRLDRRTPEKSTAVWVEALLAAGLWATPVRSLREAVEELVAEGSPMLVEVEHNTGPVRLVGCPITLSETPWQQRLRPPEVGEHTREVLAEVLAPDELAALLDGGQP